MASSASKTAAQTDRNRLMDADDAARMARAAKAEIARREQARRRLLSFGEYVMPGYRRAAHLELIERELEQVYAYIENGGERGNGRLMVFVPPQTGKSTLVSMLFPAWLLGRRPNTKIALTSYVSGLAERNSRMVRQFLESGEFAAVFGAKSLIEDPVELSRTSRSVSDWSLGAPHGGGVIARGVGGGLTGHSLDLIVIDDPFRDRKEADSEARRNDVEAWYQSAVYTRARKGTAIIIMHTRWHEDDLAGRLLKRQARDEFADQYRVVCLPAQALEQAEADAPDDSMCYAQDEEEQRKLMERGMYLPLVDPLGRKPGMSVWESEFPTENMAKRRANSGESEWWPVYQQLPRSRAGTMFSRDNIGFKKALPANCDLIRYWDKAGTEGGGARSAGVLMARTPDDEYVIAHVEKGQWSSAKRNKRMRDMAVRDTAKYGSDLVIWTEQEGGSGGKESAEYSIKLLAGYRVKKETVQGSKELRAEPLADQVAAGNVYLLEGDWNEDFLRELEAFPQGRYKDQVDAASGAFNKLALMPRREKKEARSYSG